MADSILDVAAALRVLMPEGEQDLALLVIGARRLGRLIEAETQRMAFATGFEISDISVIAILWLAGPNHLLSPTELSDAVIQTKSGMTKTLRRLERAGMVERLADPVDGRRQLVRLTPAGTQFFELHERPMIDRWAETLRGYDASRRARLARDLWSFVAFVDESFSGRALLGGEPHERPARRRRQELNPK
jgi:DNA-binding MarR family transcriptional regulator